MPHRRKRQNSNYQITPMSFAEPPPRNISTIFSLKLRRRLARVGMSASAILIIFAVIWLADAHKGYDVRQVGPNTYQIDVVLQRPRAQTIIEQMRGQKIDDKHPLEGTIAPLGAPENYPLRDVRLPGGILATGTITYAEAAEFYLSGQERTTISTIWRASEHTGATISEADNTVTAYVEFSYRQLMEALYAAREEPNLSQYLFDLRVNLPENRQGVCSLTLERLVSYTRRMHKVGAKRIIIPYYWQLDLSKPAKYPNLII